MLKNLLSILSKDSIAVVAEMLQGEKWVTFMTTELTRKGKKKSN
jgi:hypothetical protein